MGDTDLFLLLELLCHSDGFPGVDLLSFDSLGVLLNQPPRQLDPKLDVLPFHCLPLPDATFEVVDISWQRQDRQVTSK